MVRPVVVSTVTAAPLVLPSSADPEEILRAEIDHWDQRLEAIAPDTPDLVVLPEAADRPDKAHFSSADIREYYAHRGSRMRDHLGKRAQELNCNIAYSTQRLDADAAHNRTEYLDRSGNPAGHYDKNHLVIAENEELGLQYGTGPAVVDLDFGRVGTAICFDLNFDELRAGYAGLGVELLVFNSEYHGGLMQNYWAYDLRSYFVASIRPPAPSAIISPQGETLAETTNYFPHVSTRLNLDYCLAHLDENWEKLAALRAAYRHEVVVHDPGRLGSVLITSESESTTAREMAEEFEIELLDDYFARCRAHRTRHLKPKEAHT